MPRRLLPILALSLWVFLASLPVAAAPEVLASGRLEGRSRHTARGGVTLLRTEQGTLLVLDRDFAFDGAPDPKLAFGKGGYARETLFSELASNDGAQVHVVPARIDVTRYDEVWIWCEKFDVPLGVASLR